MIKGLIVIKTKNYNVRKAALIDILTNSSFAVNVTEGISKKSLTPEQECLGS
jgi:hypothetical protein